MSYTQSFRPSKQGRGIHCNYDMDFYYAAATNTMISMRQTTDRSSDCNYVQKTIGESFLSDFNLPSEFQSCSTIATSEK